MDDQDELPLICDQCLGDSDHVRLTKNSQGANCKICTLPFNVYQFKLSNRNVDQNKTLICRKCAKQRNICQCCMLDMVWHISLQLRDRMLAMINGDQSLITEEVKNEMMKKFVALQDIQLGGALVTSDPNKIDLLMNKLHDILDMQNSLNGRETVQSVPENPQDINQIAGKLEKFKSVDISHVLRKIPLKNSFELNNETKSFFLCNIDDSLSEWRIKKSIADLLNDEDWQDRSSNSLIIHHKAKCGGIRFKSEELATKFVKALLDSNSYLTSHRGIQRGILLIGHFRVFVIPWNSGFSVGSFGNNSGESIKLGLSLDKFLKVDISNSAPISTSEKAIKTSKKSTPKLSTKRMVTKKRKKTKRISGLNL